MRVSALAICWQSLGAHRRAASTCISRHGRSARSDWRRLTARVCERGRKVQGRARTHAASLAIDLQQHEAADGGLDHGADIIEIQRAASEGGCIMNINENTSANPRMKHAVAGN